MSPVAHRKRQQSRLIVQFPTVSMLVPLPTNNIGCMRITGGKLLKLQRNVANLPDLLQKFSKNDRGESA